MSNNNHRGQWQQNIQYPGQSYNTCSYQQSSMQPEYDSTSYACSYPNYGTEQGMVYDQGAVYFQQGPVTQSPIRFHQGYYNQLPMSVPVWHNLGFHQNPEFQHFNEFEDNVTPNQGQFQSVTGYGCNERSHRGQRSNNQGLRAPTHNQKSRQQFTRHSRNQNVENETDAKESVPDQVVSNTVGDDKLEACSDVGNNEKKVNSASVSDILPACGPEKHDKQYLDKQSKTSKYDKDHKRYGKYPSGGGKNKARYAADQMGKNGHREAAYSSRDVSHRGSKTGSSVEKKSAHKSGSLKKHEFSSGKEDDETQKDVLIEQLQNESYECMVCCEVIRCETGVWSCSSCYHMYHLYCIKKWARSPTAQLAGVANHWRCPSCQHISSKFPNQYRCFCGKIRDPEYNRYETPHSCGDICRKKRGDKCKHPCNILCHPGPCPSCHANVTKWCPCGKKKHTLPCSQTKDIRCLETCGKPLNCVKHKCSRVCHSAPCAPCQVEIMQSCYCGANERFVICGTKETKVASYSCAQKCGRILECGNHFCDKPCHEGSCDLCQLMPSLVTHCPCGKTMLSDLANLGSERKCCTDPIMVCDKLCEKELVCGPEANHHRCQSTCHGEDCPPCEGITPVTCRCGIALKEFPCSEAKRYIENTPFLCEKRCSKKRQCGKHKCNQLCCVDKDHPCDQICGRKLLCGLHKCEEPCHRGNCPPCWHVSFDELSCHCGSQIIFPPIPCGTKPPECDKLCIRQHACDHPVRHNCHSEDKCPPCAVLTKKRCMGDHQTRNNIPCHLTDISCGMPCNKQLPCEQHNCKLVCHKGECLKDGEACSQPCQQLRSECGHPCGAPCHVGQSCPKFPCKAELTLRCKCGNRSGKVLCLMGGETAAQDFNRMTALSLASKIQDIQSGESVDISDLVNRNKNVKKERKLECNEQCGFIERNKRVALALEIRNPDLQAKLGTPNYTQFLKDMARQNPSFVAGIEKALSELVQNAKKSKHRSRSHAFPPMNRDQRQTVHELAEFYGCETQSYDNEPMKNVVATAQRDKCWLPSLTLTSSIQRIQCPKAPPPIPHDRDVHAVRAAVQASKQTTNILKPVEKETGKLGKNVDYFDYFDGDP